MIRHHARLYGFHTLPNLLKTCLRETHGLCLVYIFKGHVLPKESFFNSMNQCTITTELFLNLGWC